MDIFPCSKSNEWRPLPCKQHYFISERALSPTAPPSLENSTWSFWFPTCASWRAPSSTWGYHVLFSSHFLSQFHGNKMLQLILNHVMPSIIWGYNVLFFSHSLSLFHAWKQNIKQNRNTTLIYNKQSYLLLELVSNTEHEMVAALLVIGCCLDWKVYDWYDR
jgi:hypothetical protein